MLQGTGVERPNDLFKNGFFFFFFLFPLEASGEYLEPMIY